MLPLVKTPIQKVEKYEKLISKELFKETLRLGKELKGLKVFHVNATPRGGGVAEVLKSLVPLMKGVGIRAEWYTIPPRNNFFDITKKMHNALQGKEYKFPFAARKKYMFHMARTANLMRDMQPDIWVIHDPQPVGTIMFLPGFGPAICRIHIDLTSPNREVWKFLAGFLDGYDRVVLSSKDFVREEVRQKAVVFQPAIDILATKNQPLPLKQAQEILKSYGIDPAKPLIAQVSRFDPWKDPLGVIRAYRIAKKKIPNLQLAMVGFMLARDDPEAEKIYAKAERAAEKDPQIFLFSQLEQLGSLRVDVFVNAIQTASNVILQKSVREGFGMCVLPDTEILTMRGSQVIKEIKVNDEVLSEDGEFHKVKDKISRVVDEYLEITAWKGIKVGVTKEHPFLATSKSRKVKISEGDLKWTKARELSKGNFIAVPVPQSKEGDIVIDLSKYDEKVLSDDKYVYYKYGFSGKREFSYRNLSEMLNENKGSIERAVRHFKENTVPISQRQINIIERLAEMKFVPAETEKINRFIPLNRETQWLIGWYIAEGDTNGNFIEINAGPKELEKIMQLQKIAEKYFGKKGTIEKRDNRVRLIISSKILSNFFSIFGKKAKEKNIPDEWMSLGKNLKWLILGLLEGDGVFLKDGACLNTTSKKLAWQVWQILLADKIPSKVSVFDNSRGFGSRNPIYEVRFGGREYYRFCEETVVYFGENPSNIESRKADAAIVLNKYILLPIRDIKKVHRKVKVYDISVEGVHSFVGNGYLLHNTVAEAMWKGKAVIGGKAGGIKLQIKDGQNGFLVSTPQETARKIVQLLESPALRKQLGRAAKQTVQAKFSMPRLLRDYLKLFKELVCP